MNPGRNDDTEPADMPSIYLKDAILTETSQLSGWISRNTVVVLESNKAYLICGRRVKPEQMKTFSLYIGWRENGYYLWIPTNYRGQKWSVAQRAENLTYLPIVEIYLDNPQNPE